MISLAAAAAVAIVAGAVAAIAGFGIGSLLTPVIALSLGTAAAIPVVAVPHAAATALRWLRLRGVVHWPMALRFGLASAAGGLAGALLHARLSNPALTAVLGGLLVLAGTAELRRRPLPLPQSGRWSVVGGLASGFFGGLVGNQGGIRSAALLGANLTPQQFVATATTAALLVDAVRLPVYVYTSGSALSAAVPILTVTIAGVLIGTLWGERLLRRIPERLFRLVVGVLLILLGASLIATAV
jgi:uncharacterized membrane protein YfcA